MSPARNSISRSSNDPHQEPDLNWPLGLAENLEVPLFFSDAIEADSADSDPFFGYPLGGINHTNLFKDTPSPLPLPATTQQSILAAMSDAGDPVTFDVASAETLWEMASEEAKEYLATRQFYRELETIKLKQPLLDPEEFRSGVVQVQLFNREEDAASRAARRNTALGGGQAPSSMSSTSPRAERMVMNRDRSKSLKLERSNGYYDYKRKQEEEGGLTTSAALAKKASTVEISSDEDEAQTTISADSQQQSKRRRTSVISTSAPSPPPILAKATFTVPISDDEDEPPEVSGPFTGLIDTDVDYIRNKIGYRKPFNTQFAKEIAAWEKANFTDANGKFRNLELGDQNTMLKDPDWLPYLRQFKDSRNMPVLYKGFPMVEEVTFIKHPNHWNRPDLFGKLIDDGQCYWISIALLVYGDASSWLRVKAEHLAFFEQVLSNEKHPRHLFYKRENQVQANTMATGPDHDHVFAEALNWWERLQIPGCWTSEDMITLTADVYRLFVVLYKYHADEKKNPEWVDKVYDMRTYGAYNNRHVFLCYFVSTSPWYQCWLGT